MGVRWSPDRSQKLRVRENPAGVPGKEREQFPLPGAQCDRFWLVSQLHPAVLEVDLQPGKTDHLWNTSLGASVAERCSNAREQLADCERLFYVIVGAAVQGGDLLALAVPRRKHDHRHLAEGTQPG